MAGKTPLFVGGTVNPAAEESRAKELAKRYRCEFVDLRSFHIHHDLFRSVPVDLMFRYNFVPLEECDGNLAIAIADPSQLMMIDEVGLLLGKRLMTKVATLSQITDLLKKTEQSQRVLEEASEGFALDVIKDDDSEETISIERLTQEGETSPIIRLVDTTIFTALQRRASDIHIESRDDSSVIKYRIDGVLQQAMPPIGQRAPLHHHQPHQGDERTGHRRAPRAPGRALPRALQRPLHRLPRVHHAHHPRRGRRAPRAGQGVDEREVPQPHPRRGGLQRGRPAPLPPLHRRALRHGAGHRPDRQRQDHHPLRRR